MQPVLKKTDGRGGVGEGRVNALAEHLSNNETFSPVDLDSLRSIAWRHDVATGSREQLPNLDIPHTVEAKFVKDHSVPLCIVRSRASGSFIAGVFLPGEQRVDIFSTSLSDENDILNFAIACAYASSDMNTEDEGGERRPFSQAAYSEAVELLGHSLDASDVRMLGEILGAYALQKEQFVFPTSATLVHKILAYRAMACLARRQSTVFLFAKNIDDRLVVQFRNVDHAARHLCIFSAGERMFSSEEKLRVMEYAEQFTWEKYIQLCEV